MAFLRVIHVTDRQEHQETRSPVPIRINMTTLNWSILCVGVFVEWMNVLYTPVLSLSPRRVAICLTADSHCCILTSLQMFTLIDRFNNCKCFHSTHCLRLESDVTNKSASSYQPATECHKRALCQCVNAFKLSSPVQHSLMKVGSLNQINSSTKRQDLNT